MARSKKANKDTQQRRTDKPKSGSKRRNRNTTEGDTPKYRIEKHLRDCYGFPHIEQGCRHEFQCIIENYRAWSKRYLYAVRLALIIPGIQDYEPPLDMQTRFWDHIMSLDMRKPHTVLAIALERLDALDMLDRLPGGRNFERAELPRYVTRRMRTLERDKVIEAALTCLDVLVIAEHRDGLPINWDKVKIDGWPKSRKQLR